MTPTEALSFIHQKAWQGSKPGLSRTRELLDRLGRPQDSLRFVHVAGTNGKGSVCAMLASVLKSAGYKTGLYTSPYITVFNERMSVNGAPIPDAALAALTAEIAPHALAMEDAPTEFELVTALAFQYFKTQGCDLVVLETGLGGRLDSTNVIENPLCAVITNIGLDHTRELGETLEEIAAEKAGIIKDSRPTVAYALPGSVQAVLAARCQEKAAPLITADFSRIRSISDSQEGQVFSYRDGAPLSLPLLGAHQLKNAAVALETIEVLRGEGFDIPQKAVEEGLSATFWPARFEILSRSPYFIVDGGHNPQCAETVVENLLRYFPDTRRVLLFGVLADKDYLTQAGILSEAADAFVTITPDSPRALSAEALAEALAPLGKPVFAAPNLEGGVQRAMELAGADGLVCSVGSLYTAGRVRRYILKK